MLRMQQKSTQKILLFSVAAQKSGKNKSPVQNPWNIGAAGGKIRLRNRSSVRIAGITGIQKGWFKV